MTKGSRKIRLDSEENRELLQEEQTAALSLVQRSCLTLDTGLMCSLVHFETGMGAEAIDVKALHKDAGDLKFTPHICK